MSGHWKSSARALAAAVRARQVPVHEAVESGFSERAPEWEPQVHAIVHTDPEARHAAATAAVLDAPLPRRFEIDDAEPGAATWMLLGGSRDDDAARRRATDRDRLARAGHAVGALPESGDGGPPAALLCRWAAMLGLL